MSSILISTTVYTLLSVALNNCESNVLVFIFKSNKKDANIVNRKLLSFG